MIEHGNMVRVYAQETLKYIQKHNLKVASVYGIIVTVIYLMRTGMPKSELN
jgi:hypothetical protein